MKIENDDGKNAERNVRKMTIVDVHAVETVPCHTPMKICRTHAFRVIASTRLLVNTIGTPEKAGRWPRLATEFVWPVIGQLVLDPKSRKWRIAWRIAQVAGLKIKKQIIETPTMKQNHPALERAILREFVDRDLPMTQTHPRLHRHIIGVEYH
jgi:hypothetical protein